MRNIIKKIAIFSALCTAAACMPTSGAGNLDSTKPLADSIDRSAKGPIPYKLACKIAADCTAKLKTPAGKTDDPARKKFHDFLSQEIIKMLASADENQRANSAEELGQLRKPCSYDALIVALEDPSDLVKTSAARAIGLIGNKQGAYPLANLLRKNSNPKIRRACVVAIGRLKNPAGAKVLRTELRKKNSPLLVPTIRALGNVRDKKSASDIKNILQQSKSIQARSASAVAIGQINSAGAQEILLNALTDPAELVRYQALCALARIGKINALGKIKPLLKDSDYSVRQAAKNAIKKIQMRSK